MEHGPLNKDIQRAEYRGENIKRAHEGLIPTRDIGPFFHPTRDI